jgi:Na+-driven multidrug efflux pump
MILAPILIFGWGTGRAFGVTGAAIATFIAVVAGIVWLAKYFVGKEAYLHFNVGNWRPQFAVWRKVLGIGLPTGFEFAVISIYLVLVYSIARPFGTAAQAASGSDSVSLWLGSCL